MNFKLQQRILLGGGLALLAALYFLGPTTAAKKAHGPNDGHDHAAEGAQVLDFEKLKAGATGALSASRQQYLQGLEASVKRGDVKDQTLAVYRQLASFWKDSAVNPVLHFYYLGLASELDNTEKNLTFAAHSILGYLPYAHNQAEQVWLANRGKELFEKALQLNANNDSSIVGLGGTIMYGAQTKEGPMEGILKVRQVAEKDSNNLFAQYMLGIGGLQSGQYSRAAQRFEKVAKAQPKNLEVLFKLAEAYELDGNKEAAIAWYKIIAQRVDIPAMQQEINKRIEQLQAK